MKDSGYSNSTKRPEEMLAGATPASYLSVLAAACSIFSLGKTEW